MGRSEKPLAPHVQAAIAAAAQPKTAKPVDARGVAPHVRAAVTAAAQPQTDPSSAQLSRPTPAAHVTRAVTPPGTVPQPSTALQMSKRKRSPSPERKVKVKKKRTWDIKSDLTVEGATGHSGSGYKHVNKPLVIRRTRGRYKKSRREQLLGQLSTQLYFMLKGDEHKVTEVESLYAGGCLFFSCNLESATQALFDKLLLTKNSKLWKYVTKSYGGGKTKTITGRMGQKIQDIRLGNRDVGEANEIVNIFAKNDLAWVDLRDKDAGFWIGCLLAAGGFTVVVFGPNKRHAEVKLVKALEAAEYKGFAVVQGKKRPCFTCAAYMRLRQKEGYTLCFSDHPGKLWKDEYDRSEPDVQKEVRRNVREIREMHKTKSGEGWRSESESESED